MNNGNTVNKGVISELKVEVDLLSKGYHVFRSESPGCPCDIVAIKDKKCIKIEIRTVSSKNKDGRNDDGSLPKWIYHERLPGFIDWWAFVLPDEIVYQKAGSSHQVLSEPSPQTLQSKSRASNI